MNSYLKQATASQSRALGPFVSDTDFKTVQTGLTIANTDIKLIVNGGASANKNSGGGTHRANGVYGVTFDATDTATVGEMYVVVVVSGALPVFHAFIVVEEEVYDDLFAASAVGYLKPTTAGRDLDVSAAGNAGIDWANIDAPTTSQTLSGTTVGIATAVTTVNGLAANVITATSIQADAITAAKVADGTIDAATFAAGAITATVIATNAIDADAIAADAVTEIQAGLATSASIVTLQADTDNIQTRLPAALVSGRMDSSVGAMAADTLTASALAADAVTEIQAGLATATNLQTVDDNVDAIKVKTDQLVFTTANRVDSSVLGIANNAITAASINTGAIDADALATDAVAEIADGVWDEAIAGHLAAGSTGAALNAAGSAGDPWVTPLPGAYGAGTAGFIIGTNINTTISSRASQSSVDTVDTVVDAIKVKTDQLTFTTPGQVDATVVTNGDKTGYTTTQADQQNSADEFLNRNIAGSGSGNTRNVRNAIRTLRNKVAVVAGVATVYAEDDTTPAFAADITTTAGDPITTVDPTT